MGAVCCAPNDEETRGPAPRRMSRPIGGAFLFPANDINGYDSGLIW